MVDNTRYYDILGVTQKSNKEEIRAQYKKLTNRYHPDNKDEGSELKFQEISEAYEVLSDSDKKKIYDKYGEEGLNKIQFDYEEYQVEGKRKKKCKNRVVFIHVCLEDIYLGSHMSVECSRKILCKGCDGTGTDNPAARKKCQPCQGKGEKIVLQRAGMMVMQNVIDCNDCECTGWEKNQFICEDCDGKKIAFDKKTINIDIEKGSPDGYRFTFFGEGDQAPKAQNGDLIIELVIKKHQYFRREGADIYYKQDLSLLEAISGFKKIIPSLDKMENLLIETSSIVQHGEIKVIPGKGLPFFNSPKRYGNMFIEFMIIFPSTINEDKLKLVEVLLSERYHGIDKKIEEEKESYVLSNFNPDEVNTNVTGGRVKQDKMSKFF